MMNLDFLIIIRNLFDITVNIRFWYINLLTSNKLNSASLNIAEYCLSNMKLIQTHNRSVKIVFEYFYT